MWFLVIPDAYRQRVKKLRRLVGKSEALVDALALAAGIAERCWNSVDGSFYAIAASGFLSYKLFHWATQPSSYRVLLGWAGATSLIPLTVFIWRFSVNAGSHNGHHSVDPQD